jgi:hypothetical protein
VRAQRRGIARRDRAPPRRAARPAGHGAPCGAADAARPAGARARAAPDPAPAAGTGKRRHGALVGNGAADEAGELVRLQAAIGENEDQIRQLGLRSEALDRADLRSPAGLLDDAARLPG